MTATTTAPDLATWSKELDKLVVEAAANREDLAELLGAGVPNIVDGRAQLYPYRLLADVSALLTWVQHLDDPITYLVSREIGGAATRITVRGTLRGVEVELIAATCREIPVERGRGAAEVLAELAAQEQRAFGIARRASTTDADEAGGVTL